MCYIMISVQIPVADFNHRTTIYNMVAEIPLTLLEIKTQLSNSCHYCQRYYNPLNVKYVTYLPMLQRTAHLY